VELKTGKFCLERFMLQGLSVGYDCFRHGRAD